MKMLCLICVIALACACAKHRVRCDGRLELINSPSAAAAVRAQGAGAVTTR